VNKQTTLLTAVLAVGSLLLLSGCAKYKAMPLPKIAPEKKGLTLEHKVFTKQDCKTYLGRKNVLKKGFQPVQLTLTNNTDHSYTYSSSSLSLPTVPAKLVAKKVKFSTAGRILGYGAAAAGFVTLAAYAFPLFGALTAGCHLPAGAGYAAIPLIMVPAGTCATGFSIAAVTDGIKSGKANKKLIIDFANKEVPLSGILKPYQIMTGVIFVPKKSFNNNFTFTLNDADTNKAVVLSSDSELVDVK
jgi:hypothetical protein